jgi:hypothetical protein
MHVKMSGAGPRFDCAWSSEVLTIMSAATKRLSAAIGRRVRAMAARFSRPAKPELYGHLTRDVDSVGVVQGRLNKRDGSPEHAEAMQACLPIGPSCC